MRLAAKRAFDVRMPEAEVLDLVHDSRLDDAAEDSGGRRLRFAGRDDVVDARVKGAGDRVAVDLALTPAGPAVLQARGTEEITSQFGPDGRASVMLASGLVSFIVQRKADPSHPLQTAWVRL